MTSKQLIGTLTRNGADALEARLLRSEMKHQVRRDLTAELTLEMIADGTVYNWAIPSGTMVMAFMRHIGVIQFWLSNGAQSPSLINVHVATSEVFAPESHDMKMTVAPKPESADELATV